MVLRAMKNGMDEKGGARVISVETMNTAILYTEYYNSYKEILTGNDDPTDPVAMDCVCIYIYYFLVGLILYDTDRRLKKVEDILLFINHWFSMVRAQSNWTHT